MPPSHPPAALPADVAQFAEAEVAAGRYASVDDVVRAGVHALRERAEAEHEWLKYAREQAANGFAELDRGEGAFGTPDELMARIDAQVARRTQK